MEETYRIRFGVRLYFPDKLFDRRLSASVPYSLDRI
jgi:hypothetical protein